MCVRVSPTQSLNSIHTIISEVLFCTHRFKPRVQWNPSGKDQERLTKVAKFDTFPCTIVYKSYIFYSSWQATSFERPPSWVAFIYGLHCTVKVGWVRLWKKSTQKFHLEYKFFCKFGYGNHDLTINVQGPSYLGLTRSISLLLMARLLTSPGHQQPWYWLRGICRSWSHLRKDFKYLCHINVE